MKKSKCFHCSDGYFNTDEICTHCNGKGYVCLCGQELSERFNGIMCVDCGSTFNLSLPSH